MVYKESLQDNFKLCVGSNTSWKMIGKLLLLKLLRLESHVSQEHFDAIVVTQLSTDERMLPAISLHFLPGVGVPCPPDFQL